MLQTIPLGVSIILCITIFSYYQNNSCVPFEEDAEEAQEEEEPKTLLQVP